MRKRELVGRRSSSENNHLAKRQTTDESLPPSKCDDYLWENELDKNKYFVGVGELLRSQNWGGYIGTKNIICVFVHQIPTTPFISCFSPGVIVLNNSLLLRDI